MTHEQLQDKLRKAMGNKIPIEARPTWAEFLRTKGTSFFMNFDWIKDMRIEKWAEEHSDLECFDYSHGLKIEIYQPFRDKNGRLIS